MRHAISYVINAFKCRNYFFVMCHHNDGGIGLFGHGIQNSHHSQRPFAVQRCRGFVGQYNGGAIGQCSCNRNTLLFTTRQLRRLCFGSVHNIEGS